MALRLLIAFWAIAGSLAIGRGDETPAVAELPDPHELVVQLGAPSFQVREQAARDLRSLGAAAVPALETAVAADDLEVKYRAQRLLDQIAELEHEGRLERYAREPDAVPEDFLPGLARARELFATDEAGRELFIAMQRAEPKLFRAVQRGGAALEAEFANTAAEHQFSFSRSRPPEASRVSALLFVASTPGLKLSDQSANFLCTQLNYAEFKQSLSDKSRGPVARKLMSAWMRKPGEAAAFQRVTIALQNDIPEGLSPALEVIDGRLAVGAASQYAIVAVARFGNREHLPVLEKLLRDATVITTQRNAQQVVFETQVRDIALAALLHLTEQDLKKYGFTRVQRNPQYLFLPHTVGFESAAARQTAHEKWQAWRADHTDELGPVVSEAERPDDASHDD